jgi:hypothetical protein
MMGVSSVRASARHAEGFGGFHSQILFSKLPDDLIRINLTDSAVR